MRHYVWTIPVFLTLLSFGAYYGLPVRPQIEGAGGLLERAAQALTLLPGFFITALAAVATFNRPEMDETMPEPAPTVEVAHRGKRIKIDMTRRLFLSYLFSYLSILSFVLLISASAAPYVNSNLMKILPLLGGFGRDFEFIFSNVLMAVFVYFCASLLVTMLHGIYFLCERIHMPNT